MLLTLQVKKRVLRGRVAWTVSQQQRWDLDTLFLLALSQCGSPYP